MNEIVKSLTYMKNIIAFKQNGPWNNNAICMARAGSYAYGTSTPDSDFDYRGVFLAERKHLIGLSNIEAYTEAEPNDLQCYELRHFIKLCLKGSPLQIEMLFYNPIELLYSNKIWDLLVANREIFLSKHLKSTLGGFAQGDIQRIKGNNLSKCGAKGKLLVEKYGYNTKHAANAYRLLQMANTLFTTGQLIVRQSETIRNEVIAIKQGKYQRDYFLAMIEQIDKEVFAKADNSNLPSKPDYNRAEELVMDIYYQEFTLRK